MDDLAATEAVRFLLFLLLTGAGLGLVSALTRIRNY